MQHYLSLLTSLLLLLLPAAASCRQASAASTFAAVSADATVITVRTRTASLAAGQQHRDVKFSSAFQLEYDKRKNSNRQHAAVIIPQAGISFHGLPFLLFYCARAKEHLCKLWISGSNARKAPASSTAIQCVLLRLAYPFVLKGNLIADSCYLGLEVMSSCCSTA